MTVGEGVPVLRYATGAAGVVYEQSLEGVIGVLAAADESHWRSWMESDLARWRGDRSTEHHQRAYGGMGSFNDLWVSDVSVWLNAALHQLRGITWAGASAAEQDPSRFIHVAASGPLGLSFWRCQACASEYCGLTQIQSAAAAAWASWSVPSLVSGEEGVRIASAAEGPAGEGEREAYVSFVASRAADLSLTRFEIGHFNETPCPRCGKIEWWAASAQVF